MRVRSSRNCTLDLSGCCCNCPKPSSWPALFSATRKRSAGSPSGFILCVQGILLLWVFAKYQRKSLWLMQLLECLADLRQHNRDTTEKDRTRRMLQHLSLSTMLLMLGMSCAFACLKASRCWPACTRAVVHVSRLQQVPLHTQASSRKKKKHI